MRALILALCLSMLVGCPGSEATCYPAVHVSQVFWVGSKAYVVCADTTPSDGGIGTTSNGFVVKEIK
jgi:hypothetical protein